MTFMHVRPKRTAVFAFATGMLVYVQCALAQQYPSRPVRIVAASAPGSGPDVVARLVAQKLTERLGQQVVVENRAGVGGNLGAEVVARAAPDGYMLLLAMASHAIGMTLYRNPGYDLARDLAAVAPVASAPSILVTHPSLPATSVQGLIALARARPGGLLLGSGGSGTQPHLCAELFRVAAKISFVHVPYKGITPALTDLQGGQLHFAFSSVPAAMPFVRSARLRALAVTTRERSVLVRGVPSIAETLPGYEALGWYGLVAPAGTPAGVVERLHAVTQSVLGLPDLIEQLRNQGAEPMAGTSAWFGAFIASEIRKWGDAVKAVDARPE
jgi:tripartite-type tricarboxylate transporter receptor subunit TctC